MSLKISLGNIDIGEGCPVFVIAEIGINHNGDLTQAIKLIDEAKSAGAHAAKIQTYITEKRVSKDSPIYGILKKCELSFNDQKKLFQYASENKILLFSTPFDDESIDFLESVNVSCFKIASFDIVNKKLVRKIADKKKPMIISRGMASRQEIDIAIKIVEEKKCPFALLHCVSAYPVKNDGDLNLSTINALKSSYNCPVGYSDHTLGIEAAVYAVAVGAKIIEKHFTISKTDSGPDHLISMEPGDLKRMIQEINIIEKMLGNPVLGPVASEKDILQYRRVS